MVKVTSAFSQRDSTHLFSNMIGLYFFGRHAPSLMFHSFIWLLHDRTTANFLGKRYG